MAEEPLTIGEIGRRLDAHIKSSTHNSNEIKGILQAQNKKLESIEIQTTKTNGKVIGLQEVAIDLKNMIAIHSGHIDSLRLWRNLLIGGGVVISAIGIATITLFLTTYKKNIIYETSEQVVAVIEDKYDLEIIH